MKRKIVVLGYGISGMLAVYEIVNKANNIDRIDIFGLTNGGNYFRNINIRWFYNLKSEIFMNKLGVNYILKYHVGAIHTTEGRTEIFPYYIVNNKYVLSLYAAKTGRECNNKMMNDPFVNTIGNRVYFHFEYMMDLYEAIDKRIHENAKRKDIKLFWHYDYANRIDIINRYVESKYEMSNYDILITTIPAKSFFNMSNFPENNKAKNIVNEMNYKNNYISITTPGKRIKSIWWDYMYVPSLEYNVRRINFIDDRKGGKFVCELLMNKDGKTTSKEFEKIIGHKLIFSDSSKITGFVTDYPEDINNDMKRYGIVCFGRNAVLDKRMMINKTYENINNYVEMLK